MPVAHNPAEKGKLIIFANEIPLNTMLINVALSSGPLQIANKLYKLGNAKPDTSPRIKVTNVP